MSLALMLLLLFIGILSLWFELRSHQSSFILIALFIIVFVLTVLSRVDNYYSYSDLGAYISYFEDGNDAYFGFGYRIFTKFVRYFWGNDKNTLLTIISFLNIFLAISAVYIIGLNDDNQLKSNQILKHNFIGMFLLIYSMYWGLSFSSEVIRSGIAITLSLLAASLLINRSYLFFIFIYTISIAFHWTQIILLPFLIFIVRAKKQIKINYFFYLVWFFILLYIDAVDLSSSLSQLLIHSISWFFDKFSLSSHYSVYLKTNERDYIFSYLSEQYIFYRITGILLLFGDFKNYKYNIMTFGYFIGLTLFSLLNAFSVFSRIQWIYLTLGIFAIYYFIKENRKYSYEIKGLAISFYMIIQTIMAYLYLGKLK